MKNIPLIKFAGIWLATLILFKINAANAQNGPIILETHELFYMKVYDLKSFIAETDRKDS